MNNDRIFVNKSKERAFQFLALYRWLTLATVIILGLTGAKHFDLLPIALVFVYNSIISMFPKLIYKKTAEMPSFLAADQLFCVLVLYLTGGWASPFYLYSLSTLLTSALLFKFRGAFYSATTFSLLYLSVLYLNGYSITRIVQIGRYDSLISNFAAFFLASIFFAYPSVLLEKLESARYETELARNELEQTYKDLEQANKELEKAYKKLERAYKEIEQSNKDLEMAYKVVNLSKRELDVLRLISEGKSNKEIADTLFLSESTIKTHVSSILRKLNLKSRSEATAYFFKKRDYLE